MLNHLQQAYNTKMEYANTWGLTQFLFDCNSKTYLVVWENGKWSNPKEIMYI